MIARAFLVCTEERPGRFPFTGPDDFGVQHLKLEGPGQSPDCVVPLHWEVHLQLPPEAHLGLTQHLMLAAVPGQLGGMLVGEK